MELHNRQGLFLNNINIEESQKVLCRVCQNTYNTYVVTCYDATSGPTDSVATTDNSSTQGLTYN